VKRLLKGGIFSRSASIEQPKSLMHPASYGVRDCPGKPSRQGFYDGVDRLESMCGEIVEDRLNKRIGEARIPGLHKMAQAKERELEHVAQEPDDTTAPVPTRSKILPDTRRGALVWK
jgi:hypothetical protein